MAELALRAAGGPRCVLGRPVNRSRHSLLPGRPSPVSVGRNVVLMELHARAEDLASEPTSLSLSPCPVPGCTPCVRRCQGIHPVAVP